jgi:hypothetical protein
MNKRMVDEMARTVNARRRWMPSWLRRKSLSALDDVHGETAARGLLVLVEHVAAGVPHRLDRFVQSPSSYVATLPNTTLLFAVELPAQPAGSGSGPPGDVRIEMPLRLGFGRPSWKN